MKLWRFLTVLLISLGLLGCFSTVKASVDVIEADFATKFHVSEFTLLNNIIDDINLNNQIPGNSFKELSLLNNYDGRLQYVVIEHGNLATNNKDSTIYYSSKNLHFYEIPDNLQVTNLIKNIPIAREIRDFVSTDNFTLYSLCEQSGDYFIYALKNGKTVLLLNGTAELSYFPTFSLHFQDELYIMAEDIQESAYYIFLKKYDGNKLQTIFEIAQDYVFDANLQDDSFEFLSNSAATKVNNKFLTFSTLSENTLNIYYYDGVMAKVKIHNGLDYLLVGNKLLYSVVGEDKEITYGIYDMSEKVFYPTNFTDYNFNRISAPVTINDKYTSFYTPAYSKGERLHSFLLEDGGNTINIYELSFSDYLTIPYLLDDQTLIFYTLKHKLLGEQLILSDFYYHLRIND